MATTAGIHGVCETIAAVLRREVTGSGLPASTQVIVFRQSDFTTPPITEGVSVYLYRVTAGGAQRNPSGRRHPNGDRDLPRLPVDLHLLLTAWGQDASVQHSILGWMLRALADHPVLTAVDFAASVEGVFSPEESVELVLGDIANDELFQLWERLGGNLYQISVPYVARNLMLESRRVIVAGEPVQERQFDYQFLPSAARSDED